MQQEQLNKIIEPEAVSFWPPQPGWYLVLAGLIALCIFAIIKWKKHRKKTQYKRDAMHAIEHLSYRNAEDVHALNKVLKYVAITTYGRREVADLYGNKWLAFLSKTQVKTDFSHAPYAIIGIGPFDSDQAENLSSDQWNQLKKAGLSWVKNHGQIKP